MIKKIIMVLLCAFIYTAPCQAQDDPLKIAEQNKKELEKKRRKEYKKLKKTQMTKAETGKKEHWNSTSKNIKQNRKVAGQGLTPAAINQMKFEKKRRKKLKR